MDIGRPYVDLGAVAIDAIAAYAGHLTITDWQADITRQSLYREHHMTQAITFQKPRFDSPATNRAPAFLPRMAPILARLPAGILRGCFLVKLPPLGRVLAHDDLGAYFARMRRYHVPIETNDGVVFRLGGVDLHMARGRLYEINNCAGQHACSNDGDTARVHLIFDMEPADAAANPA